MRLLTIRRLQEGDDGTFGVAYDERGQFIAATLERPWVDADHDGHRDRNVSRIPAGEYEAFRRLSPKRGFEVFEFANVPDTSNAQIHPANLVHELEGCIAVGLSRTLINGQPGIASSRAAFDALMKAYPEPRIRVVIHEVEASV